MYSCEANVSLLRALLPPKDCIWSVMNGSCGGAGVRRYYGAVIWHSTRAV